MKMIDRVSDLLETEAPSWLTIAEIVNRTGVNLSTVRRSLFRLRDRGLVTRRMTDQTMGVVTQGQEGEWSMGEPAREVSWTQRVSEWRWL